MTGLVDGGAIAGGSAVVLLVLGDAIGTLVVTQSRTGPIRPTRLWYSSSWRLTRSLVSRLPSSVGDYFLNLYPAVSLLGLLVLWLAGLMIGWALVYWGLDVHVAGGGFGNIVYLAGASLVTPSPDLSHQGAVRMVSLLETLSGLGTIALLISYLPALYSAYSRREVKLLTLDDPFGGRITPVRVIAVQAEAGGLDAIARSFAEWENWTAEVLESHVSYPMLALFRSQHAGQSWVTALGVVTDAASLVCACVDGAERIEPYFLYRRGRRTIGEIAARLHIRRTRVDSSLSRESFDVAWAQLVSLELPLRDKDEAWDRLVSLRSDYGDDLQRLIEFLLAPHGFWGHSAEATVVEEMRQAEKSARQRTRPSHAPTGP